LLDKLSQLWRRLLFYFRGNQFDRELEEEMRFHLEMKAEENLAGGASPEEARYAAQRQFGNQTLLQEVSRDMWAIRFIETLFQDLRYGTRMLLKRKGFTAVAALSLALGIGANTAIFSLIDAVLLKTLSVEQPEQLYFISSVGVRSDGNAPPYPCYERFRDGARSFIGLAAFSTINPKLKIDGQLEEVRGQRVSGNYFSLLGVSALLGRTLTPALALDMARIAASNTAAIDLSTNVDRQPNPWMNLVEMTGSITLTMQRLQYVRVDLSNGLACYMNYQRRRIYVLAHPLWTSSHPAYTDAVLEIQQRFPGYTLDGQMLNPFRLLRRPADYV